MTGIVLRPTALSAAEFAAFGDVIETDGRDSRWINDGTCRRFDDLARIDVLEAEGRPLISIFEANPRAMPLAIRALERHPLSSQAFFPLHSQPFLVVVAQEGPEPWPVRLRVYLSSGGQGINYRRNVWHHSLIALGQTSRFLVVDRGGTEDNCEEVHIEDALIYVDVGWAVLA
jgi:ureidoglycolate lyase